MARKRKKKTKAQRRKIALRNLKKARAAKRRKHGHRKSRKRSKSRRKRRRSRKHGHRKSRRRSRRSKRSRRSRRRRRRSRRKHGHRKSYPRLSKSEARAARIARKLARSKSKTVAVVPVSKLTPHQKHYMAKLRERAAAAKSIPSGWMAH